MTRTFSYIPTGHTLRLTDLDKHEYFGEDLKAGKTTVAIFKTEAGKFRAVWSYGDWAEYDVTPGDKVAFQHTQTMRRQTLELVTWVDSTDYHKMVRRNYAAQWTLK